jgi:hypothetical protein
MDDGFMQMLTGVLLSILKIMLIGKISTPTSQPQPSNVDRIKFSLAKTHLPKNGLASEKLRSQPNHKTQHGQTAIPSLGKFNKSKTGFLRCHAVQKPGSHPMVDVPGKPCRPRQQLDCIRADNSQQVQRRIN